MDFEIVVSRLRGLESSKALVLVPSLAFAAVFAWGAAGGSAFPLSEWLARILAVYRETVPDGARAYLSTAKALLFDPILIVVVGGVLVAERFIPADPKQKPFSTGLVQDFFWYFGDTLVWLAWIPLYAGLLRAFYDEHLPFLTIEAVRSWPAVVQIVVSVLFIDFLRWFRHFLKHRWWFLWCFHAVHHSQRELNVLTDFRFHIGEKMTDLGLTFVLLYMFDFSVSQGIVLATFLFWYPKIYHGNLRTRFGILRHVLVTPQYHRIHHSLDPAHANRNLGTIFTIWDRLFGTMHPDGDEYPETGLVDPRFPVETSRSPIGVVRTWTRQNLYPLAVLFDAFSGRSAASAAGR